ncbi:MAG TPA: DUF438 domain-containing protein [Ignavibacteriales bacterium]|nr:DUF438 domain-containing protein [Ignavibacteriales bacterium]
MSEIINNRHERLELLKSMILKINHGETPESVRQEISQMLKEVPYEDVVQVEQELFLDGADRDNMLELCDLHSDALKGIIDLSASRKEPAGHPVHTFKRENQALKREISFARKLFNELSSMDDEAQAGELMLKLHANFNNLMDVDKHYLRKENLLFPFLEKYQITGPSAVMWGKDDEARGYMKNALAVLHESHEAEASDGKALIELALAPALNAVEEMIYKEEQILFPMAMDTLKDSDWFEILRQSEEIGYCLFVPTEEWRPEGMEFHVEEISRLNGKVNLPTGSFSLKELASMMNTFPFDVTFVDKDDYVRFFSHGKERIFQRNKAILGRKVQFCHPPSSLSVVEKILDDFRNGRQEKAEFWINMRGRFIFISYYAVRSSEENEYLGTLEVTQDLTRLRALEGERRILSYDENTETEKY